MDENASRICKALSNPTRVKILDVLPLHVCGIAEKLGMTQPDISYQIKILEEAGLIRFEYERGQHGTRKICYPIKREVRFET